MFIAFSDPVGRKGVAVHFRCIRQKFSGENIADHRPFVPVQANGEEYMIASHDEDISTTNLLVFKVSVARMGKAISWPWSKMFVFRCRRHVGLKVDGSLEYV